MFRTRSACFLVVALVLAFCGAQRSYGEPPADPTNKSVRAVISGVISDAFGKPLSDVVVNAVVLARPRKSDLLGGGTQVTVVGRATTDAKGHYQVDMPTGARPGQFSLQLFAYAPGYGVTFQFLDVGKPKYDVSLTLPQELPVAVKLLGSDGKPLAAAAVKLCSLAPTLETAWSPFIASPPDLTAWPKPFVTRDDGSLSILGVAENTAISVELDDPRAAHQRWKLVVDKVARSQVMHAKQPRNVEGRVVAGATGLPIAGATVILTSMQSNTYIGVVRGKTDRQGCFALRPFASDRLGIDIRGADRDYSYFNREIPWPEGTTTQRMTLPLDKVGFERADGTTPDGRPASTIDTDYPAVKVARHRPTEELQEKLSGTIIITGTLKWRDDKIMSSNGMFAVNPESGDCRLLAGNVAVARISPDGTLLAYTARPSSDLRIIPVLSPEKRLPTIEHRGVGTVVWANNEQLIADINTPAKRDYQGEEYWGQESTKLRLNIEGDRLGLVKVPPLYTIYDASRDGQWLALHWDTHAHLTGAQLYLSRPDGSELKPLARKHAEYYWYPLFSPDGKSVLAKHLDAHDKGRVSVRIIAVDGSHERSIVVGKGGEANVACWSPDGKYIAIATCRYDRSSNDSMHGRLFIVDAEGKQLREIHLPNVSDAFISSVDWTAASLSK